MMMFNGTIRAKDVNGKIINKGVCEMTFTDAIASGQNEYVPITYLLVRDTETNHAHIVKPRDVIKFEPDKLPF